MSSWFRSLQKSPERTSKESKDEQFIRSQVQEALGNLRNAEMLVHRSIDENMKRQALQIYQNTLGILIQVLNSKQKLPEDIKKEVLAQHVKKALTQAEKLKESLSPQKRKQKQKQSTLISPSSKPISPSSQNNHTQTSNISKSSPHLKNPFYPLISQTIHIPSHSLSPLSLSSISGLQSQKQTLQTSLLQPLLHPHLYTGLRTPPCGILLYGPPGTGKTMLVKALAYESRQSTMFFSCTSASLSSKWHGEGEKIVSLLFQIAREASPSIIFLDEMDSLFGRRDSNDHEASRRLKTEFMVQIDGITGNSNNNNDPKNRLWVLGCTNTPWDLDEAILRRMEVRLYVPLPDANSRKTLLQHLLQQNTHNITSSQLTTLVEQTKGYSCSDLRGLGREAAFGPLRDMNGKMSDNEGAIQKLRPIKYKDFEHAIKVSSRSVSKGLLQRYQKWESEQSGVGVGK